MSQALARAPGPAPAPPLVAGSGRIATLQAGGVIVRHQPPGPFELSYDGTRPVLLFSFGGHGAGPACRGDSFALLKPGVPVSFNHPDPVEVLGFAYEPQAVPVGSEPASPFDMVDPGVRALAHEARRVLLQELAPDRDYVEALGRAALVRAVQVLRDHQPTVERTLIAPLKLRRVVEHIDANLADKITVAELAEISGLSTAYFARLFHQATGEAPHHFILSRRVARVQELLADPSLDLATVAYRAGFSSHAHMTTAFKRKLGLSPAAYRAAMLANPSAPAASRP
jgi:AraC family transcriptional regulator